MSSFEFPPATGTTLEGRFVVQRLLGGGGMGVVILAEHLGLRRHVAMKLLRPDFLKSQTVVHRFLLESRAMANLKSEHVVDVLDAGVLWKRIPYFVMEYLPGTDLGTTVQRSGPLDVEDVVDYTLQTLEALAESHRRGIIHRDLKPTNLFLTTREDGSGLVKVLDFGVSKLVDWEVTNDGIVTRRGTVLGSPAYMSPEQIKDASKVDGRSDIWAIGTVMHELLTGSPPFDAPSIGDLIRAICAQPYELPNRKDLPLELKNILLSCMRKDLKARFQNVEELARAFQPLARTPASQVSIDRILRGAVSVRPPPAIDGRASLPSITPITANTSHATFVTRARWRDAAAGAAVAGAVAMAFSLGRLGHDTHSAAARGVTPVVAPLVNGVTSRLPVLSAEPRIVTIIRSADPPVSDATPSRRPSETEEPQGTPEERPSPTRSMTSSTLPPGSDLPMPIRKYRQLDTQNPFVK